MTDAQAGPSEAVEAAARWLKDTPRDQRGGHTIPVLKKRFDLDPRQAVEAIREADALQREADRGAQRG